ncbi:MAG: 30S ribosomal protein S7 [Candidatus Liberibacter ctenarytainae]|uniref:Small ribosomal subunit protein uS7 n=1 Tax=Candidatus Liberibacter ctenarytainae TaxID=2020335 RepID=A0A937ACF6_9HYPH|nr:30S ribosomal protein S7 [Candidatus Liberibacter ctenarytainae]
MSRRRKAVVREVDPDPKFLDSVVTKFMNAIMSDGKKSVAERIVYGAFDLVQQKEKQDPVELFHNALKNTAPHTEVRSRRVGGASYSVPNDVSAKRSQALAIRWIIAAARKRNETTMIGRLGGEILDAVHNRGIAVKKREETHKVAEANRAFSHYRW